jgi:hypothetical protein
MPTQAEIDALNDAIVDNAQQPNRVRFGNREVQQNSLADQIDAANHVAAQVASGTSKRGLLISRLVPPGCG